MKTHWKKQFNYDYLGSYSLADGKDVILTIEKTCNELVTGQNGQKEQCFICYFVEKADWIKPMILNRTNCKTIEKVYGSPFIEDWAGVKIQIGIEQGIKAFGEMVDGLRIRNKIPQTEKPVLTKTDPAWQNAIDHIKKGGSIDRIKSKYQITKELETELLNAAK